MTIELLPAPGQSTFRGTGVGPAVIGVGVGLTWIGLGLGLACIGLGGADRAAIEPGEAPTLQALKSTSTAKSGANRPMHG